MDTNQISIKILPDGRMDAKNAALYLGLSVKSLASYRGKGKNGPPFIKRGKVFYYRSDLDAWLEQARYSSTAQARLGRSAE